MFYEIYMTLCLVYLTFFKMSKLIKFILFINVLAEPKRIHSIRGILGNRYTENCRALKAHSAILNFCMLINSSYIPCQFLTGNIAINMVLASCLFIFKHIFSPQPKNKKIVLCILLNELLFMVMLSQLFCL